MPTHQRQVDRFVLSKKPVENRQSTNLCKSNLSAIPAEVSRMLNLNNYICNLIH